MTLIGPLLFLLGLGVCWAIGRYIRKGDGVLVPAATALFGIAGLLTGFPEFWVDHFIWSLVVLAVYGGIGAMVFRTGRAQRGGAE